MHAFVSDCGGTGGDTTQLQLREMAPENKTLE